jgi:hypothetical protein
LESAEQLAAVTVEPASIPKLTAKMEINKNFFNQNQNGDLERNFSLNETGDYFSGKRKFCARTASFSGKNKNH